jgi:hypothetical protein
MRTYGVLKVCTFASTSVPFRSTTVKMPNLALIETKQITVLCMGLSVSRSGGLKRKYMYSHPNFLSQATFKIAEVHPPPPSYHGTLVISLVETASERLSFIHLYVLC